MITSKVRYTPFGLGLLKIQIVHRIARIYQLQESTKRLKKHDSKNIFTIRWKKEGCIPRQLGKPFMRSNLKLSVISTLLLIRLRLIPWKKCLFCEFKPDWPHCAFLLPTTWCSSIDLLITVMSMTPLDFSVCPRIYISKVSS